MDEMPDLLLFEAYTSDRMDKKATFDGFARDFLSPHTEITVLTSTKSTQYEDYIWGDQALWDHLTSRRSDTFQEIFFVANSYNGRRVRLRISKAAYFGFEKELQISPSFTFGLSLAYTPTMAGSRVYNESRHGTTSDCWYFLPLRLSIPCENDCIVHPWQEVWKCSAPLHLYDLERDICPSHVAIHWTYDSASKKTKCIVLNMARTEFLTQDSTPEQSVIKEMFDRDYRQNPFLVHIVYLDSAIMCWILALMGIERQLFHCEKTLQSDTSSSLEPALYDDLNKFLQFAASQVHIYGSELKSIEEIATAVSQTHTLLMACHNNDIGEQWPFRYFKSQFIRILSQVKSLRDRQLEIRKNINVVALLLKRKSLENDKVMMKEGMAMQRILEATREETKNSHEIAVQAQNLVEGMRKDSLSMKTIAVLGMLFLPGTSFAAILLAMPFFDTNPWLTSVRRIWIWFVLSVPSTGVTFAFYWYSSRSNKAKWTKAKKEDKLCAGNEMGVMKDKQMDEEEHEDFETRQEHVKPEESEDEREPENNTEYHDNVNYERSEASGDYEEHERRKECGNLEGNQDEREHKDNHEYDEYDDNDDYETFEWSDKHEVNSLFTIPENDIAT